MTVGDAKDDTFLTVALVGVSSRSRAVLDMFFSHHAGHLCRLVDDLAQAQIGIVDLDGPQAHATFAAYRKAFQGPTLALSVRDPELDDAVWVSKPVRPTALLAALTAFSKPVTSPSRSVADVQPAAPDATPAPVLDATPESSVNTDDEPTAHTARPAEPAPTPDAAPPAPAEAATPGAEVEESLKVQSTKGGAADVRRAAGLAATERRRHPSYGTLNDEVYKDPEQCQRCFYDPRDYFQGALQKALAVASDKQLPMRVKLQSDNSGLTIFPGRHAIQSEIREHLLRSLSMVQGGGETVTFELLPADTKPALSAEDSRLQTEFGLLWKIALWTSLGRAPVGADPRQPVSLLRWPNFTRVFISKHAMPIAALWAQRPTSLLDTARILEIEHRYVFSFYSAASAVGIVAYVDSIDGEKVSVGRSAQRGILGRLLTYLGARD